MTNVFHLKFFHQVKYTTHTPNTLNLLCIFAEKTIQVCILDILQTCKGFVRISITAKKYHDHINSYKLKTTDWGGLNFQRFSPL